MNPFLALAEYLTLLLEALEKKTKKIYMCEICGTEKTKQQDLLNHKRNVHGEGKDDTPHCDICNKKFGTKSSLKLHTKSKHEGEYIHNCQI